MFDIRNRTPFMAFAFPQTDKLYREGVTVVVKGTYDIKPQQKATRSSDQFPIEFEDQYFGEPGASSISYESDLIPFKPTTDVALVGSARSAGGEPVTELDVELQVESLQKRLRIFGDRRWQVGGLGLHANLSKPEPFSSMPITYERAFGGADPASREGKKPRWETRNPVGTGFFAKFSRDAVNDRPLPNIEHPDHPIRSWNDKPVPQGFGFIGRHWKQRRQFIGTYDGYWQEERCPILPEDFDERFFQAAHPDLVSSKYLLGNEAVKLVNLSPAGTFEFKLPRRIILITASIDFREKMKRANLDTIVFFTDLGKMVLVWRAVFTGFETPWDIKKIDIGSAR